MAGNYEAQDKETYTDTVLYSAKLFPTEVGLTVPKGFFMYTGVKQVAGVGDGGSRVLTGRQEKSQVSRGGRTGHVLLDSSLKRRHRLMSRTIETQS